MFTRLIESIWANAGTIFVITIILSAAVLASFLLRRLLSWYQKKSEQWGNRSLGLSVTSFASKALNLSIFSIAFITILAYLKVEITPFITGLGVVGIAIALASQDLFSNFFGALAIFMDRPFKQGDRIRLTSGESGNVVGVGIRSTRIKTLDHRVIVVPNAEIASSNVDNYSLPDPKLRYTLRFGIDYRADVEKASRMLAEIAAGMTGVLEDPAPAVYVEGLGKFSVNLVLLVWVEDFQRDSDVPDWIYRQAIKSFAAEGIEIPYPITTVRCETVAG